MNNDIATPLNSVTTILYPTDNAPFDFVCLSNDYDDFNCTTLQ